MRSLFISVIVGAIAGALGWVGAVLMMNAMDSATFASIPFGWTGLVVGSVAVAAIAMIIGLNNVVEPVVASAGAAATAVLLWERRELPFDTEAVESGTPSYYWASLALMVIVFLVLMIGLRSARVSNRRARG